VGKGNRCNYRILILIAVWFIGCMQRVTNILFSLVNTNNIEDFWLLDIIINKIKKTRMRYVLFKTFDQKILRLNTK